MEKCSQHAYKAQLPETFSLKCMCAVMQMLLSAEVHSIFVRSVWKVPTVSSTIFFFKLILILLEMLDYLLNY